MFKVIIAGGRTFTDYELLKTEADRLLELQTDVEIVSGTARGADQLGERYANERNYPVARFQPDWNLHGKSAGYKRNAEMADYADGLIAFWDGESKGTKHMIDLAHQKNIHVRVIHY